MARNSENEVSKNYLFEADNNGTLKFIGNFEQFYAEVDEPWGQSGSDERLQDYYLFSRNKLMEVLKSIENNEKRCLELGCGQGYVLDMIQKNCSFTYLHGIDISSTAITKAKELHPDLNFSVGNICSKDFIVQQQYDVLVLNEVLWYLLEDIEVVFANIKKLLANKGYLIISTSFFDKQKYGKNIINGFNGLLKFMMENTDYQLTYAFFDTDNLYVHDLGVAVYRNTNDNN